MDILNPTSPVLPSKKPTPVGPYGILSVKM